MLSGPIFAIFVRSLGGSHQIISSKAEKQKHFSLSFHVGFHGRKNIAIKPFPTPENRLVSLADLNY